MNNPDNIMEGFQLDSKLFYEAIINSTDDYIYIINMKNDVALVTPNMQRDFELPGRVVNGLVDVWASLIHDRDKERYYNSIDLMLQGVTNEHNVEYQVQNRKGEYIWILCRGILQRDENGDPLMFAGVVSELGKQGKIDYISGLFTHRECEKKIGRLFEKGLADSCGIMLLGLDDFIRINDLNSHAFGDAVLRQFAQGVQQQLPQEASIYRFDGDEFAIVYPDATSVKLESLYDKIYAYCNHPQRLDEVTYFCTVSAGAALLGRDSDNYPGIIRCASGALEASKKRGKNVLTLYSPELMQGKIRALEMTNQLQLSVIEGMKNFCLVFQPFVYSDSLKIAGAEALLRWSCEPFGEVSPMEFIPLLESSGLILPVGKWVLDQAAMTCRDWSEVQDDFVMNINVSYLQMLDEEFIPTVEQTLCKYKVDPKHIVLELTESYFVTNMGALRETFRRLRDFNIKIAMDDFGTGYSSLGMLAQSPADIVKIDRLFITDIAEMKNAFNRNFIGSVIKLCHSVGIAVCVEGVERTEELDAVCDMEADCIQGFYISRPISEEIFRDKYLTVH
ncbi:bifunctional diguanylate cyclase/phosphodiesterase [Diplocloster modestus]|uniref:GGDEF and EAL domain-containing protein n=1 Tax=Diplocloster modestus TaxID=2850322 RepID=A0ABS6KCA7_9FIRM|nr:GGDEF and EAL domain-containing protein [Diplocloster modestus]MBU9728150.1 GGDEF and EAL domain-containing protein [Diplocloster modestus]